MSSKKSNSPKSATKQKKSKKISVTKKNSKIVKDFSNLLQKITKPAIRRICRRAGVYRISELFYEGLRDTLKTWLERVLKDVVIFTEHNGRKTVQISDLESGLKIRGIILAAGLNKNAKHTASLQSCNSRGKSKPKKKKEPEDEEKKKTHRFKPGTVAKREIKNQQKHSDNLAIPKVNFIRLVREIAANYHIDLRFTGDVFDLLQLTAESYLISMCHVSNCIAIHSNRETVYSKDLALAKMIRSIMN